MSDMDPALLAGATVQARELRDAALALRETYRFSRWMKVTLILGALMLAANGVMLGILISLANTNRANGDAIRSCTTPTGDCYQRGQETTGRAVAEIVAQVNAHTDLVFIATLECSQRNLSDAAFEQCLQDKGAALGP